MRHYTARFRASLLALSLLLSLAACGNRDTTVATTMYLRRTSGTVSVSDGGGKELPPMNNLSLYSGYGVGTQPASYAWISLDDVKLAKLDQNSEISIQKEDRALSIELKSGSLFFNVTQPLADDETMHIRTSTMLVGIRGTCGWVSFRGGITTVYILEGSVECSAGGQTVQVNAGEYAELTADGELVVASFTVEDIPVFVLDELEPDDIDKIPVPEPSEPPEPSDTPEPSEHPEPSETPDTSDEPGTTDEPGGPDEAAVVASGEAGDGVTWTYYSDGVLTIEGEGEGWMDNYIYNGQGQRPWQDYSEDIHTVVIGDGVTYMGTMAFSGLGNLTSVTIGSGVDNIGLEAFSGCSSLTGVVIPDNVSVIDEWAFSGCTSLTSVTIGSGVTGIGMYAFVGCTSLTNVTIPDSVTSIGEWAFSDCTGLTSVAIPDSVIYIGEAAFAGCGSLTGVTIPNSVTSMGGSVFMDCTSLTSVAIPDSITSIWEGAFHGCTSLTSVTIPDSVTYIGPDTFNGCTSLTDVYYGGSEAQWEEITIEYDNDELLSAVIHYNSTEN